MISSVFNIDVKQVEWRSGCTLSWWLVFICLSVKTDEHLHRSYVYILGNFINWSEKSYELRVFNFNFNKCEVNHVIVNHRSDLLQFVAPKSSILCLFLFELYL